MTAQPQNKNVNYLIARTLTNVNRIFVLSVARSSAGDNRDFFLIDGKNFFELPVKIKKRHKRKLLT